MYKKQETITTKMTNVWARLSWLGWNQQCWTQPTTPWPSVNVRSKRATESSRLRALALAAQILICLQFNKIETLLVRATNNQSLTMKTSQCQWALHATLLWITASTLLHTPQSVLDLRYSKTRKKRLPDSSSSRRALGFMTATLKRSCSKTGLSGLVSTPIPNSWASTTGRTISSLQDSKEWTKLRTL